MKKLAVWGLAVLFLALAGCGFFGGWKTFTGTGFTVSLPGSPTVKIAETSVPGAGMPLVSTYTLNVADPKCTITILSFDSWPAVFDVPGVAFATIVPSFLGNQGNRTPIVLATKNGFTGQEYGTADNKTILRLYLGKPAVRGVMISNQTTALDKTFVTKVLDSFSPSQVQAK
jgi:hypothetical protein